ncbi:carbamoyltransferase HypF [Chloroflexota bacterium]
MVIDNGTRQLLTISVQGVVQGVGFRPFVYQLAKRFGLSGWVSNTSGDVRIEIEGEQRPVLMFVHALQGEAPPNAKIENIQWEFQDPVGHDGFEIRASIVEDSEYQLVSPDIATCNDCLSELLDPNDRRYRYPFTNCTNCGPRFTIIEDIPYDRPKTTMSDFTMCPQCQAEYDDPLNRRFHAQPNACPVCGPQLELVDAKGNVVEVDDFITSAVELIKQGKILAIKGLGGFLLACDATNDGVVSELRDRKKRPGKPFAIMLTTLYEVEQHCFVSDAERELLASSKSPIVLLKTKGGSNVAQSVAPKLNYMGVMLPYTPLHHLLLMGAGVPLVMTSGNLSEEPIAKDNDEALVRLGNIADYFIMHNRGIYSRYDDSVCMVELNEPQVVRRARSYAPFPIHLPYETKQVLGCGAELKGSFCYTKDVYAFLGQHIGDMENVETLEHYETTAELYRKLFRINPEVVAVDLHPDYLASKYGRKLAESEGLRLVEVQHHHAHIASCMVDNAVKDPVIGISFDGTGYGPDGCIWGGEFMTADLGSYNRVGHLKYIPLPGGDAAAKKPYRMAISYLYSLLGEEVFSHKLPFLSNIYAKEVDTIKQQIDKGLNSPLTSSCGRLFDAVSALAGVRGIVSYEAQAAIEMEMAAPDSLGDVIGYQFNIEYEDGLYIVNQRQVFLNIIADIEKGVSVSEISAKFHRGTADMMVTVCGFILRETGIKTVALSGGVFQNRLLLKTAVDLLKKGGFDVLTHKEVPTNDGGISLGQAAIATFADGA